MVKEKVSAVSANFEKRIRLNERDAKKRTALFYSLYFLENYELCEFLLRNGADTLWRDSKERTVLHHSVILGCSKGIIQLILDYHADRDRAKGHQE